MSKHVLSLIMVFSCAVMSMADGHPETLTAMPATPVKLIFVHHSTGEGWLADWSGGLGNTLKKNKYFVSDTNYGWGPDGIGDLTDTGHWYLWFRSSKRNTYLKALYEESGQNCEYARLGSDPGGENQIIMFKSCFPCSYIGGKPTDPPKTGSNPLRGKDCYSSALTVANVKGIYNDLLVYFKTRQDKLFILIASPPLVQDATDATHAANARAVHDWLITTWLKNYPYKNVAVFDFFTGLTSNGGNPNKNDVNKPTGNHHRYRNSQTEHMQTVNNNYSSYGSSSDDSHPTAAGGKKASAEFAGLLNVYYNTWQASLKE